MRYRTQYLETKMKLRILALCVLSSLSLQPILADAAPHQNYRPGHVVKVLPKRHESFVIRNQRYYYHGGHYYAPRGRSFVVVTAPIGMRIGQLPSGYVSFGIGTSRYFFANSTYYRYDRKDDKYVVVPKPNGADESLLSEQATVSLDLFVYPKEGQTDAQRDQDRYECHRWSVEQSQFDPSLPNQQLPRANDYKRAISACLEGRGYTVR